ncbi:hypothetical protein B6J61_06440 [Klebsiella pneumoniae]|nr:hypothetical protein [Klebsiella pneumoniae]MBZ7259436.1 hypothetical protein [Klebsiella pneumoniae]PLJ21718.1 hypothetical protein B6J61_06440 [Klebsiella pneumoniae]
MRGRSWGRGAIQHIEENAADGVAHIVFLRRCAPVRLWKIRNREFSDLRRNAEGFVLIMQH